MLLQEHSYIMNGIRVLFIHLDSVVFWLVKWILYVMFDLINLTASSSLLSAIYQRVYVIVAVFMAFKLSFAFFQYLFNPQSMVDQNKGIAKLFTNIFIMLAALIFIPTVIFGINSDGPGLLARAQNAFLPMVPRIILGIKTKDTDASAKSIDDSAEKLTAAAMGAFFSPSKDGDESAMVLCGEQSHEKDYYKTLETLQDMRARVNETCSKGLFGKRYYRYSYIWGVSTIVGIYLVFVLLGLTIDVAKRVFKLIILQVIAPIPIMSLMDPSSKENKFQTWLKLFISTYLEVFIKLAIVYLVLLLIQQVVSKGLFTNYPEFTKQPVRMALLTIALIIGLFRFASEAPKFINDALGIKSSSGGGEMGRFGRIGAAAGAGFVGGALQGNAMAGMFAGGEAGAKSKPGESAHAFRAGSDRAAQIRTGDSKYKTGFGASMNRMAGRLGGYTTRGFKNISDMAKTYANEATHAQNMASLARDDLDSFDKSGMSYADWYGAQAQDTKNRLDASGLSATAMAGETSGMDPEQGRRYAMNKLSNYARAKATDAQSAAKRSQDADKRKQKAEKGMDLYGVAKSSDVNANFGYRAARKAGEAMGRIPAAAGRAVGRSASAAGEWLENRDNVIGGAARSIDRAYQQHRARDIESGARMERVERTQAPDLEEGRAVYSQYSNEKTDSINRRDALDRQGTVQSWGREKRQEISNAFGRRGPGDTGGSGGTGGSGSPGGSGGTGSTGGSGGSGGSGGTA